MGNDTQQTRKRSILFITPSLEQGGVEHSLVSLLKLIDANKYNIDLYIYINKLDLIENIPDFVNVIKGFDCTRYYRKFFSIIMLICIYLSKIFRCQKSKEYFQEKIRRYIWNQKIKYPNKKYLKHKKRTLKPKIIVFLLHGKINKDYLTFPIILYKRS